MAESKRKYQKHLLGIAGAATENPVLDFETFSIPEMELVEKITKVLRIRKEIWQGKYSTKKNALQMAGVVKYASHESADILCLAYDLKDGKGVQRWQLGDPDPTPLLDHVASGGIIEAHNLMFELVMWFYVAHKKYGWPPLPIAQTRCSMAKAGAAGLPRGLAKANEFLGLKQQKNTEGKKLIGIFSCPRNPTKDDSRLRVLPKDDPENFEKFMGYCEQDVRSQSELSCYVPDLSAYQLAVFHLNIKINLRGFGVDMAAVDAARRLTEEAQRRGLLHLHKLTDGAVDTYNMRDKALEWLDSNNVILADYKAATINEAYRERETLHPHATSSAKEFLLAAVLMKSAAIKKLVPLKTMASEKDHRIRDSFQYCGATTGRFAGKGVQVQNLPNKGPALNQCDDCGGYFRVPHRQCTSCQSDRFTLRQWSHVLADHCIEAMKAATDYDAFLHQYGSPIKITAGCLRGMITAKEGYEFIGSDYSAIEARILAHLAGEEWRCEIFATTGLIYETSAAKITGVPLEEILDHKRQTGEHHPHRKIGKTFELACGFGGSVGAAKREPLRADRFMNDEEIQSTVNKWRAASPMIRKFWNGLQGAAMKAMKKPGARFAFRGIVFSADEKVLLCTLLSGRNLTYHRPRIGKNKWDYPAVFALTKAKKKVELDADGVALAEVEEEDRYKEMALWGGLLCENVVQATAADILMHALLTVEAAGLPVIAHIHDEICVEAPIGSVTIEQLESLMMQVPDWCADWDIKAAGGWIGKRYRKD